MIRIVDIAEKANVSPGTVSKILKGTYIGSQETKERVLKIAKDLGYTPNIIASSLKSRRTRIIALIVPEISVPFFPELSRGVEDVARENDYNVILCSSNNDPVQEAKYLESLERRWVDGIIFSRVTGDTFKEKIPRLLANKVKMVFVDRVPAENRLSIARVEIDNKKAAYSATEFLIKLGHRDIACITGPLNTRIAQQRLEGYKRAFIENNIPLKEDFIVEGTFKLDSGFKGVNVLLEKGVHFTAIFACNDLMAVGAIKALRKRNLDVPNDVSVIGFDGIPLCEYIEPALTTVVQPIYEMGKTAAELLLESIREGIELKGHIVLDTRIEVRESTREVRVEGKYKKF
ncbi:TPA: LacI family transcriptional regulator [bacterium]|nr:LacI family transcriptional regulator [bacterium]